MKGSLSPIAFLKNVFSYSVATWVNFVIYGASILLATYFIPPEVYGPVDVFISATTFLMSVSILGLDQAYTRFFHEPPGGVSKKGLFSVCAFFSVLALLVIGSLASIFFPDLVLGIFFTSSEAMPSYVTPLLFLNALFLIAARFYNITYRMEGNVKFYTLVSVGLQFFSRIFFVLGAFVSPDFLTIVLFYTAGLFLFALVFTLVRRDRWIPKKNDLKRETLSYVVPFGVAVAPATVIIWLTSLFSRVFVGEVFGEQQQGIFSMALTLSNVIAVIQAGFATFWSAYIYANYKENQQQIMQVHDYVTFATCIFFGCIVAFEDVLFFVLGAQYRDGMELFLLLSLMPLFLIISETTVYGISIKRMPIYDTVGMLISLVLSVGFTYLLSPVFGLVGTSFGLALAGIAMFIFRSIVSHRLYRMVASPLRTGFSLALVVVLALLGTYFTNNFPIKFTIVTICVIIWCYIYRKHLKGAVDLIKSVKLNMKN